MAVCAQAEEDAEVDTDVEVAATEELEVDELLDDEMLEDVLVEDVLVKVETLKDDTLGRTTLEDVTLKDGTLVFVLLVDRLELELVVEDNGKFVTEKASVVLLDEDVLVVSEYGFNVAATVVKKVTSSVSVRVATTVRTVVDAPTPIVYVRVVVLSLSTAEGAAVASMTKVESETGVMVATIPVVKIRGASVVLLASAPLVKSGTLVESELGWMQIR